MKVLAFLIVIPFVFVCHFFLVALLYGFFNSYGYAIVVYHFFPILILTALTFLPIVFTATNESPNVLNSMTSKILYLFATVLGLLVILNRDISKLTGNSLTLILMLILLAHSVMLLLECWKIGALKILSVIFCTFICFYVVVASIKYSNIFRMATGVIQVILGIIYGILLRGNMKTVQQQPKQITRVQIGLLVMIASFTYDILFAVIDHLYIANTNKSFFQSPIWMWVTLVIVIFQVVQLYIVPGALRRF